MMTRLALLLLTTLVLWTCTTQAPAPVVVAPLAGPDDDHRLVSRDEFHNSPWAAARPVRSWVAEPTGLSITLADGRVARLSFVAPSVVRWWVPAAIGEAPLSPAARFPTTTVTVKVKESGGLVWLETPALSVKFNPDDASWAVVRGDKTVVAAVGGPLLAGRRVAQDFDAHDQPRWFGPGLDGVGSSARFWLGGDPTEGPPALATPALVGVGGAAAVGLVLDNSYQTYSRLTAEAVRLGALNGGLDLLVAAAPQPGQVVEALTSLTGRPRVLPQWAYGAALALPDSEPGTFVRQAKLSIQSFSGAAGAVRAPFQALIALPSGTRLPDLSQPETRQTWLGLQAPPLVPGTGIALPAMLARDDWSARFEDQGAASPLARMNNRLPSFEAQTFQEAWQKTNPQLRSFLLAASASWGTVREALPEVRVVAGADSALASVLVYGASGLSTPAIRLDLTALADPATKAAAFQSLLLWSLAPVLTLDWGPQPARFWSALTDGDRQRVKNILDHRSAFKPVFAQAGRTAAATGRPAWRPLWFLAPSDARARDSGDEFLLGDDLLAAPVTGGAVTRSVYLPGPGVWFDFWTGDEYGGGQSYDVAARTDRPLIFARGGSLIPQRESESFDEKDLYNPLTVHVFPGGRGTATYYWDDGRSLAWSAGVFWETKLTFDFSQKEMSLEHQTINSTGALKPDPYLLYRVHNVFKPRQVKIDGKAIPLYGDSWGITDTDRSAAWYEGDHTLLLKTFRPEKEQSIVLSF